MYILSIYSEFACPVNQHPNSKIKKNIPYTLAHLVHFSNKCRPCLIIGKSCYFDYRMNKPFTCSRCLVNVLCSVHVISAYCVRKGPWALLFNYPWINGVRNSDRQSGKELSETKRPSLELLSAPKCSSRHFIFHRKCVSFE